MFYFLDTYFGLGQKYLELLSIALCTYLACKQFYDVWNRVRFKKNSCHNNVVNNNSLTRKRDNCMIQTQNNH